MEKRKASFSLPLNIAYSFRLFWDERKSLIIFAFIGLIMRVALPFAGILMPKLVIDELTNQAGAPHFLSVIGGMAALLVVLSFLKSYTDTKIDENFGNVGSVAYALKTAEKLVYMDYEMMEDPEVKKLEDKAETATQTNHTLVCNLLRILTDLLVNLLGFLLYGTLISMIHPLIILLLAVSAGINWLMLSRSRKVEKETREDRAKVDQKLRYVYTSLGNRKMAKDIRMYSMVGWLKNLFSASLKDKVKREGRVSGQKMLSGLTDGLLILLRDGAAYAFLVYLLMNDRLALGDFVLIFAAIGTFSGWVSGIILQSSDLMRASSELTDYRTFIELPDKSNTGPGAPLPPKDRAPAITLSNVGYTYPGADSPALEDINLEIKSGERIALVGANGAGKTTLIKLICGLYKPKTGTIAVDGTDITAFNRDKYFGMLSAVFQDIHLLTTSIAGNVSQQTPEKTDRPKVERCLKLAGLYEKVSSLPDGMDTLLVREVNEKAIELSGGELQKLALARALYKDAPIIILDEPTAALDPIAENEVYRQYAELTKGKTSIYISHRLASTRFCDRVLFLGDHKITEEGTHEELIRKGGRYAEMYEIQASYYSDREVAVKHE
jgi:ABC-type multidrug transport system fused ATPase/permease subunit